MKKLITIALASLLISCTLQQGPVGPQGETGKQGNQGVPGSVGATGTTGKPGVNGTNGVAVSSSTVCMANIDDHGVLLVTAKYSIVSYIDGSTWVSCQVKTSAGQYVDSNFYAPVESGSKSQYCSVTSVNIKNTSSYGFWTFGHDDQGVYFAEYTDVDSSANNFTYKFDSGSSDDAGSDMLNNGCTTVNP